MGAVEEPFNPLSRIALAESVVAHLEARPTSPLPPESFIGAGVYALYYTGGFPCYAAIADAECRVPIYVGEAIPAGGRIGGLDLGASAGPALANRLRKHSRTIEAADNIDLSDFRCRHLIVEDIWVPLAEQLMIYKYRPVWNVLSGFGNNDPGVNRYAAPRPLWHALHPGVEWAARMAEAEKTPEEIAAWIEMHLAGELAAEAELGGDNEVQATTGTDGLL